MLRLIDALSPAETGHREANRGGRSFLESAPSGRRASSESTDRRSRGTLSARADIRCEVSRARDIRAPCHARTALCCQTADAATRLPGLPAAPGTSDWSGRWEIARWKPGHCSGSALGETAAAGRGRVLRQLLPLPPDRKVPPYSKFLSRLPVRQQRVFVEMRVTRARGARR